MIKALSPAWVKNLSQRKHEPAWMLDLRLQALDIVQHMSLPTWGPDLKRLPFDDIAYYCDPFVKPTSSWHDVPDTVRATFDALGIPQAERSMLAGVGAQFESEVIYKRLKQEWMRAGVIFCDMSTAVVEHEDLVRRHFSTIIPPRDNFFAALNTAVWSGGSFVYIPPGVVVDQPLQAYFRIEQERMGQFERTLIIAAEDAQMHYVEGCSAPVYTTSSLHAAVVEIVAHAGAQVQYTTIQNWSTNVFNLVTKRAYAHERARVSWIDGNFGSGVTMKYPSVILAGKKAQGYVMSIAVSAQGQHHDSGAKMIHLAPETTSTVIAKSLCRNGGRSSYRGLIKMTPKARASNARVQCDALLYDSRSRADTYPTIENSAPEARIGHEASVVRVDEHLKAYLACRGIAEHEALALMVHGFVEPFVRLLPMEYAIEINRLIDHNMEGSVG